MKTNFALRPMKDDAQQMDLECQSCFHRLRKTADELETLFSSPEGFRDVCANCQSPFCDFTDGSPELAIEIEESVFGKTVTELMSNRGELTEVDLLLRVGFVLMKKNLSTELKNLSQAEQFAYAIHEMICQVNTGGFAQFFDSGSVECAIILVPALEAVGSINALAITREAIERFGKPKSLSLPSLEKHFARITRKGEDKLWDDLDDAFYELDENIEMITLNFIQSNIQSF